MRPGAVATVLVALSTALLVGGCSEQPALPVPAKWEAFNVDGASLVLQEDGVGMAEQLPLWNGTDPCSLANTVPFDGIIQWSRNKDGAIVIGAPAGDIWIWPDGQFFSSTWDKFVLGPCGKDTRGTELIAYQRDLGLGASTPSAGPDVDR